MTVTFLAHSGFFVELETCCLLFDWWKGDLPESNGKPLFCFASHRHYDHFIRRIFTLDDGSRPVTFLLSHDILLVRRRLTRWGVSPETAGKCVSLPANTRWEQDGVTVETLRSTDQGVAFLVTAEGKTIYHAGDLNWWYWAGEGPAWNRSMAADFKRCMEPLRGRAIDLAMVPLDPTLGESEDWGLAYFLELARVETVLPMHQWDDPSPTGRFRAKYPRWAGQILDVDQAGQRFIL